MSIDRFSKQTFRHLWRSVLLKGPISATQSGAEVAAAPTACPGMHIGRYRVLRALGSGGQGSVWIAEDTELGRPVAIKFLNAGAEKHRQRFVQEARLLARLSHPNIVPVYDVGLEAVPPYLVMEFVEGVPLEKAARALSHQRLAQLMVKVAQAVAYMHEHGTIHRDLKPENVLMRNNGEVVVVDFGLAKDLETDLRLSRTGAVAGTPAFMAPEQILGNHMNVGPLTDVYGLGALLYTLLAERPPFAGRTSLELMSNILNTDPKPPSEFRRTVPSQLEAICLKALEKSPERRYASALAMGEDLQRFLAGEPVLARSPSRWMRLRRRLWRRRIALAVTGLLSAMALTLGILVPELERAKRTTHEAQQRQQDLQVLGTLWAQVVVAKQGLHQESQDPAKVRERIERAVQDVSGFIAQHGKYPQGYYVAGWGKLYLNRLDEAEADIRKSIELEPEFAPGWALLGRIKLDQYQRALYGTPFGEEQRRERIARFLEEAKEALDRGWGQDSGQSASGGSIARWGLTKTPEDDVAEVVARALWLRYVANRPEAAREFLEETHRSNAVSEVCNLLGNLDPDPSSRVRWQTEAIRFMPHHPKAYLDRGGARADLGENSEAVQDDTKAITLNPLDPIAYVNRGVAKNQMRDYRGAVEDLTKAIELDPDYASAYTNRAAARIYLEDSRGAIEDARKAIELDPEDASAYDNRGVARGRLGDEAGAVEDATRAIELAPKDARPYRNRAGGRVRLKDFHGAIEDATKAIELHPKDARAYAFRGSAKGLLGDFAGADEDLTAAIHLGDGVAWVYSNRAAARVARKDFAGAIQDYSKAIDLDPRDALSYANRAGGKLTLGDYAGAIEDASQAIRLDPGLALAHRNRGQARMALKQYSEADRELSHAIELYPALQEQLKPILQEARRQR